MDAVNKAEMLKRETNPLFNDRKMKLATFCTNLSGGCAITTIDGVLEADWASTLGSLNWAMRWNSKRWFRSDGGRDLAARRILTARDSKPFRGPPALALPRSIRRFSPPRTCRRSIRSWRPSRRRPSITSAGGRFALNIVTGWHAPGNRDVRRAAHGSRQALRHGGGMAHRSSSVCGRKEGFDFSGNFYDIKRGICSRSRSGSPIRC